MGRRLVGPFGCYDISWKRCMSRMVTVHVSWWRLAVGHPRHVPYGVAGVQRQACGVGVSSRGSLLAYIVSGLCRMLAVVVLRVHCS